MDDPPQAHHCFSGRDACLPGVFRGVRRSRKALYLRGQRASRRHSSSAPEVIRRPGTSAFTDGVPPRPASTAGGSSPAWRAICQSSCATVVTVSHFRHRRRRSPSALRPRSGGRSIARTARAASPADTDARRSANRRAHSGQPCAGTRWGAGDRGGSSPASRLGWCRHRHRAPRFPSSSLAIATRRRCPRPVRAPRPQGFPKRTATPLPGGRSPFSSRKRLGPAW